MKKNKDNIKQKNNKIELMDFVIFGITFIILGTILLAYFPGIITSDIIDQIGQAETNMYSPDHPIIHTFFVGNLTKLGGIWVPALVQIITLSLIWTYVCNVLRRYNNSKKNKICQIILTVIIFLMPITFMYSITLWKDIMYSYGFLLLIILMYIGMKENYKYTLPQIILFSLSCVIIMKFRHNGFPIGLLMLAMFMILNFINVKKVKETFKFLISFIIIFMIMTLPEIFVNKVTGPVSVGGVFTCSKIYAMGGLLNSDVTFEKEDIEFLNKILDTKEWKELYTPYNGTPILFNENIDLEELDKEDNKKKFDEIFLKYAKQKPKVILNHLISVNSIWWSIPEKYGMHSLVLTNDWVSDMSEGKYDNHPILKEANKNLTEKISEIWGNSFKNEIQLRPATMILITLIAIIIICVKEKKIRYIILMLPMWLNIGTYVFFISSQDQRYFYPCNMTAYVTVLIVASILTKNKKKKIENKKNEIANKKNPKTLIIVPAYNEEKNIKKTVEDIKKNSEYDYIVINDCSKDRTKEVCEKNGFNLISLPINNGLTSVMQLGMKYAYQNGYDIAIQFDGDGQHQAKYLKKLVNEIINNESDVVIGSRFVERKKPYSIRMVGSRLISWTIKMTTSKKIMDPTSGMRAYNKKAIVEFNKNPSLTPEPDTIVYMLKKEMKITEVQVEMKEREFGESYLNPVRSIKYMIDMFFSILLIRNITRKVK